VTSCPYAYISKHALKHNFDQLKINSGAKSKVMCAVKGNAYGHGIVETIKILREADGYAVARLSEAKMLRDLGITQPITLLGGFTSINELNEAIYLNCDIVIHNMNQVEQLESQAIDRNSFACWLKIDTGMNRLGIKVADFFDTISRLESISSVSKISLMTHLSDAEDQSSKKNSIQLKLFRDLTDNFSGDISFANSAVIFNYEKLIKNYKWNNKGDIWIRPGIALYGVSPLMETSAKQLNLKPVMQFVSKLIAIRPISKGESVGYNSAWRAKNDTNIGVVSVGYGDGYSKSLISGTWVVINGRRVPLVGLVSMDLITIDLGPTSDDSIGDEVVLWGELLPVEKVAGYSNLTTYALVTGVSERVQRQIR
jgi:alanine racemase